MEEFKRIHGVNYSMYAGRETRNATRLACWRIELDQVVLLMHQAGLKGALQGHSSITIGQDKGLGNRPALVNQCFHADALINYKI